jgi:cytochrome b561
MTARWDPGAPSRRRYTHVAIALHWAIAALILFNLVTGFFHDSFPRGTMAIHISSGMTILALSLVRIVWRLTHRPPAFLPMAGWERWGAHVVHFCLYAAMLLLPISGWAMISANPPIGSAGAAYADSLRKPEPGAAPRPAAKRMVWWVIPLPLIGALQAMGRTPEGVPVQHEKHEQIESFHGTGGWVLLVLLLLHVGGALKHQFLDREPEFARMGLGRRRS